MQHSPQLLLRRFCIILALVFLMMGMFVTVDLLIYLGPMSRSLTSSDPLIQSTAYTKVMIYRGGCIVLAIVFAVTAILLNDARWKKLVASSFYQRIDAVVPLETVRHHALMRWVNKHLIIHIAFVLIGILYVGVGVAGNVLDEDLLQYMNKEDGVIENLSVLLLVGCCIVSAILSSKYSGYKARALMHGVFALVFFVMAGEELSWGQRIFNTETPEIMKNINFQAETNIHNIGHYFGHIFLFILLSYGFIIPLLSYRIPFFRKLLDYIGLPVGSPGLGIGFLVVFLHHEAILHNILGVTVVEWKIILAWREAIELLWYIGFCLLMYEAWLQIPNSKNARVYPYEST